jgi:N-acetylmuramoyl-L-alanine amidase
MQPLAWILSLVTRLNVVTIIGLVLGAFLSNLAFAAELSNVRIGQTAEKTRIEFQLDQAKHYTITSLSNPERLVIDFYQVSNKLSFNDKAIDDTRIQKIRVNDSPNRTRIILDLHHAANHQAHAWIGHAQVNNSNSGRKGQRLVVDLTSAPHVIATKAAVAKTVIAKVETETVKPAPLAKTQPVKAEKAKAETAETVETSKVVKAKTAEVATTMATNTGAVEPSKQAVAAVSLVATKKAMNPEKSRVETSSSPVNVAHARMVNKEDKSPLATQIILQQDSATLNRPAELVVAIDAGHGGKDVGAIGHGNVYEKNVTLQMAKELKAVIDRQPGMRAVLTRDKDIYIGLADRVKIAKQKKADLFISVHADAFHDKSVTGGSVYVLSRGSASSVMASLLAKSENASLQDVKLGGMDHDVAFALSDLSREANVRESRNLGNIVLKEMQKTVKLHKPSLQSAGFAVLKSIDMPSLLIETAFISNPDEARKLVDKTFQRNMAQAIGNGLAQYAQQTMPKHLDQPSVNQPMYVRYKVQKGDTLSSIASSYKVSMQTLKEVNNIKNANELFFGKTVKIPVSSKQSATATSGQTAS